MRTLWKMPVGIGVVAVAMLVTPLFVRGMELDKALEAKKQGKTGSGSWACRASASRPTRGKSRWKMD